MSDKTSTNKTSTNKISAQNTVATAMLSKLGKPSKKLVAILTAGVLVLAGGITAVSVSAANAAAEETVRLCVVALKSSASAVKTSAASIEKAEGQLEQVKSVTLPGDTAWTSTEYAARAGVEAVEPVKAVPAVKASEGVEAVAAVTAVEAVAARASGAGFIANATDAQEALTKIKIPVDCTEREEAASITALTATVKTATKTLDTSVTALLDDFTVFQADETVRIAAKIEAARVAAAAEAARVAAAAEAARIAAERAAAANRYSGSGGYSTGGSSGGSSGGSTGGTPTGGGGIGDRTPTGITLCDSGHGGVYSC